MYNQTNQQRERAVIHPWSNHPEQSGELQRAALRPLVLETGLARHWTLKGKEMREQLGDFQVAFQELEELTSSSAMTIIKFSSKYLNSLRQWLQSYGSVHPLSLHLETF